MGLREAKQYIEELRKKQDNPFLWPNYLTGLPDRAAVLRKLDSVFAKLGKYAIAYVRIANVHPYLIKYGSDRHAEIIQWAAAILKTTTSGVKGSFVGTVSTHDFVLIARTEDIGKVLKKANRLFKEKVQTFYSVKDKNDGYVLRFQRDTGERVRIGLMKLVSSLVRTPSEIERINLIPFLERVCRENEGSREDVIEVTQVI